MNREQSAKATAKRSAEMINQLLEMVLLSFFLATPCLLAAQSNPDSIVTSLGYMHDTLSDSTLYKVGTSNGNSFIGYILQKTDHDIILLTEQNEVLAIRRYEVTRIDKVAMPGSKGWVEWERHPIGSAGFIAPTGYAPAESEGYYQNIGGFVNQVSVGISDHFSVKAGLLPLIWGDPGIMGWLSAKVTVKDPKNKVRLGAGAIAASPGISQDGMYGFYGLATFGGASGNSTLGLGRLKTNYTPYNLLLWSAKGRTGKKGYVATENYLFWNERGRSALITCMGGWIFPRVSFDIGFLVHIRRYNNFAFPIIGMRRSFGRRTSE